MVNAANANLPPPPPAPAGVEDSASPSRKQRGPAERWTPQLVKGGWTPVSDFFLHYYHALSPPITHGEAMLIIQLMTHKWDKEPPFPAFKTLAKRMGIRPAQARALARSLEKKKYLERQKRVGQPNRFKLEPLFEKLEELRNQKIKELQASQRKLSRLERFGARL